MLSRCLRLSCLVLGLILLHLPVAAQDPQTPPTSPGPGSQPPKSAAADDGPGVIERLIYVPFRELQKVFNSQDASVVLPWNEYLELVQRSLTARPAPAVPQDAVITSTVWSAAIEKDVARLTLDLRLNLLRTDGWATVPLNFGAAAIGKVEPSDGSVLLKATAQGQYDLLVKAPAPKSVRLELLVPVQISPEDKGFAIDCPPAGISELTVSIPEPDQTLKITPLQVQLPLEQPAPAGQTWVRASLGAVPRFEVRWAPRDGSRPVMDLLASVNSRTTARIETGLLQSRTQLNYEILRGELRELSVLAPRDARIIDVTAAAGRIRAWNAAPIGDSHQLIKVELLVPAAEQFQLEIQTERTFDGDTIALLGRSEDGKLQGVHPEGIVRESGQLTLTTDPALTAVVATQSGLRQINSPQSNPDSNTAQPPAPENQATVWEYTGLRSRLDVRLRPVEPRLLAEHQLVCTFRDDELVLNSEIQYQVERAGVFQLILQIPEGLNIDSVSADGMAEFQLDRGTGKVTLSLTRKRMGPIKVSLQARQPINSAVEIPELAIPIPAPEGVERETGLITLFAPEFLDVVTLDDKLTGLVPARDRIPEAPARLRAVGAWNFTRRPVALSVRSAPRPVQLAASTATTVQVDPELIHQSSIVQFDIRNAGLDTVRIAVPEAVATDVRFRTLTPQHTLRQRDRSATSENGWTTWTLVLQEETTGLLRIAVDWDRPLNNPATPANAAAADATPAPDVATPPAPPAPDTPTATPPAANLRDFVIEPPRVLPPFPDDQPARRRVILTEARGEIRVLRHPSLSIDAVAQSETAEPIDVRELQLLERDGYLAWRYFAQPATASIAIRKHELHEVAATVVSRAAIEVVTEPQALAAWRVRLRLTTSERQRLRIDLPANSDLQAPLLNDLRTTIEKAADVQATEGREPYYINISREGTSDEDFLLTLLYRCPIVEPDKRPYSGLGGAQLLRLPVVGGSDGATVVQQVRVAVWSPEETSFFGAPERWVQEPRNPLTLAGILQPPSSSSAAAQLNDWIGSDGMSEFATQGEPAVYRSAGHPGELLLRWWKWWFLLPAISGTLVLAGLILRRTSWENRITTLLLLAFATALLSLRQSLGIAELSRTAWPGLLLTAIIWLLGLILGTRSRPAPLVPLAAAPSSPGPANVLAAASPTTLIPDSSPADSSTAGADSQGGAV